MSLDTLMFEILLTRIFSVTLWYHFAFMAISIAMFGMTVGALLVYLSPALFPRGSESRLLGTTSLFFALTVVFAVFYHVRVMPGHTDLSHLFLTFSVMALPFVCSGVCVCLVLTRFTSQVAGLYAIDLTGAALGCLLVIPVLWLVDGVSAVFIVALIAGAAAISFLGGENHSLRRMAMGLCAALALLVVVGAFLSYRQTPLLRITQAKGMEQATPIFEKWNSYSRIAIKPSGPETPKAWSLSTAYAESLEVANLWLNIDAAAGTPLVEFKGDFGPVEYLRYDLTNFVHHLRQDASLMIVGSGGGRDILTAKLFGQRKIVAVEMNADIIDVMTNRFGEFTGHLDRDPRVTVVNDEARSFLARQSETFDIIQITFVDTWAATAAGAFVLAENSLYTREAWKLFLERLSENGILTISRGPHLAELYRLVSLARSALAEFGVDRPEDHIAVVANPQARRPPSWGPMVALLLSRQPYSADEIARIEKLADEMDFDVMLVPGKADDANLSAIASGEDLSQVSQRIGLDIRPPTDDRPFFFNMLPIGSWFSPPNTSLDYTANLKAVSVLMNLLIIVFALTSACIALPLVVVAGFKRVRGAWPFVLFFASIGFGFMLVEISMMQRLIIYLGHPIYGLVVILFVLLVAGGVGSFLSGKVDDRVLRTGGLQRLAMLVLMLAIAGLLVPLAIRVFDSAPMPARIMISAAPLAAMGVFMGMAFPLGIRVASANHSGLTPWLWGINGATSVCASVLAVAIALTFGISAGFWTGFGFYFVALVAYATISRAQAA